MDSSSFEDHEYDPSKYSKMSLEEKREIVYEAAKWSHGAPEMLQAWSRQDILQILCAEMGKDRKYTGLTKIRIIENLLKIVSEKGLQANENENSPDTDSSHSGQMDVKRQRKSEHPTRINLAVTSVLPDKGEGEVPNITYCKNLACKAILKPNDRFCKRCSCCICHKYDDNKDPSLWLTCCSDPPYPGNSCGLSCHLECALRNGKSGIAREGMDGNFFCVSCGKLNDLIGYWRKQLTIAKESRRVDILCYRLSLSHKLLSGTELYQNPYEIVEEAKSKLEDDVGPLTGLPVKMSRGIVNRLSSGPEVQRLCSLALESLDSIISRATSHPINNLVQESNLIASNVIHLEDVSPSSVTVILNSKDSHFENILGYTVWHRKSEDRDYAEEPTCTLTVKTSRYLISGLIPATDYVIKVTSCESERELGTCQLYFRTCNSGNEITNPNNMMVVSSQSPTTISSSLSNPSSVEDETNFIVSDNGKEKVYKDMKAAGICQVENLGETSNGNGSNTHIQSGIESEADLPITPFKTENTKENVGRNGKGKPNKKDCGNLEEPHDGSSSKKRERRDGKGLENANSDFEYHVKVIRRLECEGHIEMNFRQKFLTWYSLRATPQEVRVVKVFVDNFIDNPGLLAGQLVDAFTDVISSKRSSMVPYGFCLKLWH